MVTKVLALYINNEDIVSYDYGVFPTKEGSIKTNKGTIVWKKYNNGKIMLRDTLGVSLFLDYIEITNTRENDQIPGINIYGYVYNKQEGAENG